MTLFGISWIRLLYEREDGIALIMSLSEDHLPPRVLDVHDRRFAVTVMVSVSALDAQVVVDRRGEGPFTDDALPLDRGESRNVNVTAYSAPGP